MSDKAQYIEARLLEALRFKTDRTEFEPTLREILRTKLERFHGMLIRTLRTQARAMRTLGEDWQPMISACEIHIEKQKILHERRLRRRRVRITAGKPSDNEVNAHRLRQEAARATN